MNLSRSLRLVVMLFVFACTVGCDQTTKHLARSKLGERGFVLLPGGWGELRLAENPGAFLSWGDSLPKSFRVTLFTIAAGTGLAGLLVYLVWGRRLSGLVFLGLGLVCAGGFSNLIDRITQHGLVSDFIFIQIGPLHTGVFNVADVVILIGGALVAVDFWRRRHEHAQSR